MRCRISTAVVLAVLPALPAMAAGFGVREHSADAMAGAYAGAAAGAADASYLNYNPAASAGIDGGDASLNFVAILPNSAANYTTAQTSAGTPTGGDRTQHGFIRNAVIPNIALRQRLSDRWSAGLAVSIPWGLSTDYPTSFAGRYYAFDSKLTTVDITPSLAYDILPGVTVAGGFQAQYAKGTLTSVFDTGTIGALSGIPGAVPGAIDDYARVNAHSWAYGFVAGARASLDDGWTLGLSYRSAVHHTLTGPVTFTLDGAGLGAAIRGATGVFADSAIRAKLPTPVMIEMGARKQIDDRWTALLEVDWTGWSIFKQLAVTAANPAQPPDVTNARWHDSWLAAIGAEYRADDRWTLKGGFAYDGTPATDDTLGPRIPDADRYWASAGATYHATQALDLKLTYAHLFNSDRTIAQSPLQTGNALRGTLIGRTESDVNTIGVEAAYRWL